MNNFFGVSAVLLLSLAIWRMGKSPKITSIFQKEFNLLDQSQIEEPLRSHQHQSRVLIKESISSHSQSSKNITWEKPKSKIEIINLKKQLFNLMKSGPEERLKAVTIAGLWGDPSTLSILRRGLRDSDSQVMLKSAEGIKKHRGFAKKTNHFPSKPPRNVALMR